MPEVGPHAVVSDDVLHLSRESLQRDVFRCVRHHRCPWLAPLRTSRGRGARTCHFVVQGSKGGGGISESSSSAGSCTAPQAEIPSESVLEVPVRSMPAMPSSRLLPPQQLQDWEQQHAAGLALALKRGRKWCMGGGGGGESQRGRARKRTREQEGARTGQTRFVRRDPKRTQRTRRGQEASKTLTQGHSEDKTRTTAGHDKEPRLEGQTQ